PTVASVDPSGVVSVHGGGVASIRAPVGAQHGSALFGSWCGPPRCVGTRGSSFIVPATVRAGAAFAVPVEFRAYGWSTPPAASVVSLVFGSNPTGATLTGNEDKYVAATPYIASVTWPNLKIDKPGTYTLVGIIRTTTGSNEV